MHDRVQLERLVQVANKLLISVGAIVSIYLLLQLMALIIFFYVLTQLLQRTTQRKGRHRDTVGRACHDSGSTGTLCGVPGSQGRLFCRRLRARTGENLPGFERKGNLRAAAVGGSDKRKR